jgi:hypothetical protein
MSATDVSVDVDVDLTLQIPCESVRCPTGRPPAAYRAVWACDACGVHSVFYCSDCRVHALNRLHAFSGVLRCRWCRPGLARLSSMSPLGTTP